MVRWPSARQVIFGLVVCVACAVAVVESGPVLVHASTSAESVAISVKSGPPGTSVVVSGGGFGSAERVQVRFDTRSLKKVTTDATGAFSAEVTIPGAGAGAHTISATGLTSATKGSLSFFVPSPDSVAVSPLDSSIFQGATQQFSAVGTWVGVSYPITEFVSWASSLTSAATISNAKGSNGLATGVAPGSSTISATTGSVSGSTSLTVMSCSATWMVDAVHGGDTNSGACGAPFKTLHKALSVASSGQSIQVQPGTYDTANGETFPEVVPANVYVIGDQASRGTSPGTVVGGEIDLPNSGAYVVGLKVVGPVKMTASVSLYYSTVVTGGSGNCVSMSGSGTALYGDVVTNCANIGVTVTGSSATATLSFSSITANGYGVDIVSGNADLGGGTLGSTGGNTLSCNTNSDLYATVSLHAQNNAWDHNPPTLSPTPGSGVDIATPTGATVTTVGSTVVPVPCL
jgi:hypothetical protein